MYHENTTWIFREIRHCYYRLINMKPKYFPLADGRRREDYILAFIRKRKQTLKNSAFFELSINRDRLNIFPKLSFFVFFIHAIVVILLVFVIQITLRNAYISASRLSWQTPNFKTVSRTFEIKQRKILKSSQEDYRMKRETQCENNVFFSAFTKKSFIYEAALHW